MLNYNVIIRITDLKPVMTSQEDRMFLHAVMVRDAVRKLPELRAMASRKYPHLPLSEVCIKICYRVVPTTVDIFLWRDFRSMFPNQNIMANNLSELSDNGASRSQSRKRTMIVGELSDGSHVSDIVYVMASLLWDSLAYERLDTMIRAAHSSANDGGFERGVDDSQGTWQCVSRRTEMNNPKLRKRIEALVKEERQMWSDVQGTWLTA